MQLTKPMETSNDTVQQAMTETLLAAVEEVGKLLEPRSKSSCGELLSSRVLGS